MYALRFGAAVCLTLSSIGWAYLGNWPLAFATATLATYGWLTLKWSRE